MDALTSLLPVTFDKLRSMTKGNALLQSVKKFVESRWPELKLLRQHADWSQLEGFYRRREYLTIEQGCVLFRERVVIPTALRTKVLKLLHQGHPEIQSIKSLARNYAYCLGMDHEIEGMVRLCGSCAAAAKQPLKATLHSWPPATNPWEPIHTDFAGPHLGRNFLVIVDAYSKYLGVIIVSNKTSRQTVAIFRKLCAKQGVPETIVSDNGTQFTSHEFKQFCKANSLIPILSPPYHLQSNGRAERFVDTFKRGLLKLRREGNVDKILDTFLLAYRRTPSSTLAQQRCPAELFLSRKPRTTLDHLLPTNNQRGVT
jgi:transposase InsO family protein